MTDQVFSAVELSRALMAYAQEFVDTLLSITLDQAELERQGITNASPYWRSEKYLYLIHPMSDGQRKREYIGSDPGRIQSALDSIERYKSWSDLDKRRAVYQGMVNMISTDIQNLVWQLRRHSNHQGLGGRFMFFGDKDELTRLTGCHQDFNKELSHV